MPIDDSPAAPLLTLITGPSGAASEVRVQKQERAERHDLRQAFWTGLLNRARPRAAIEVLKRPGRGSRTS